MELLPLKLWSVETKALRFRLLLILRPVRSFGMAGGAEVGGGLGTEIGAGVGLIGGPVGVAIGAAAGGLMGPSWDVGVTGGKAILTAIENSLGDFLNRISSAATSAGINPPFLSTGDN